MIKTLAQYTVALTIWALATAGAVVVYDKASKMLPTSAPSRVEIPKQEPLPLPKFDAPKPAEAEAAPPESPKRQKTTVTIKGDSRPARRVVRRDNSAGTYGLFSSGHWPNQ